MEEMDNLLLVLTTLRIAHAQDLDGGQKLDAIQRLRADQDVLFSICLVRGLHLTELFMRRAVRATRTIIRMVTLRLMASMNTSNSSKPGISKKASLTSGRAHPNIVQGIRYNPREKAGSILSRRTFRRH